MKRYPSDRNVCNGRFGQNVTATGLSAATVEAFRGYQRRNERFYGMGLTSDSGEQYGRRFLTLTRLGCLLGCPECCVKMDLETKCRDHEAQLRALVEEVGERGDAVRWGLRRHGRVSRTPVPNPGGWEERYVLTRGRFPSALHAACNECLKLHASPTAKLSEKYERLVSEVFEELHSLVRWAAHIVSPEVQA